MHIIQNAFAATDFPRDGVATIGNYDGLHRGQAAILDRVVERARELRGPAIVVTFEPHPLTVLRPELAPPSLTTPAQKRRLLAAAGVDVMAIVQFDRELAETSAERFVRSFLHRGMGIREIVVGSEFAFGKDRQGNLELLESLGEELGFAVSGVEEVLYRGERISSTRIRAAVGDGRVDEVREMLGRPYMISGVIARGDRMGQRIGWPTANVEPDHELVPADGVYACRAHFPGIPASFDCATNVGTRPTVYENFRRVVESHILDFSADVYGERIEVRFYKQLREEQLFANIMDLSAQIGRDVEEAREYFAARRRSIERQEAAEAAVGARAELP